MVHSGARVFLHIPNVRRVPSSRQADYCLVCISADAEIEIATEELPLHEAITGKRSRASADEFDLATQQYIVTLWICRYMQRQPWVESTHLPNNTECIG